MNEGMASVKINERPKLLSILDYQHDVDDRIVAKIKDLNEINNRLDILANRLNGNDYPKNNPQDTTAFDNTGSSLSPLPIKPNGLVGELAAVNERSSARVGELQSVITSIFIALNYLEAHI